MPVRLGFCPLGHLLDAHLLGAGWDYAGNTAIGWGHLREGLVVFCLPALASCQWMPGFVAWVQWGF